MRNRLNTESLTGMCASWVGAVNSNRFIAGKNAKADQHHQQDLTTTISTLPYSLSNRILACFSWFNAIYPLPCQFGLIPNYSILLKDVLFNLHNFFSSSQIVNISTTARTPNLYTFLYTTVRWSYGWLLLYNFNV